MSLRAPQNLSTQLSFETGASVLDAELLQEKAASLGHAGHAVEKSLAALQAATPGTRDHLLAAAAEAVWGFFVQRELCGLRDQAQVIADYAIPREVLVRLGARPQGLPR